MKCLKMAFLTSIIFLCVVSGAYPLLVYGISQLLFSHKANGSLVVDTKSGQVIGSDLIGQAFQKEIYFHPRPSAAGYNGSASAGSNLGPTSKKLQEMSKEYLRAYQEENQIEDPSQIPIDAITSSGSGLDPHISLQNALLQIPRIAKARGVSQDSIRDLLMSCVEGYTEKKWVNVFKLNRRLDGKA